MAAVSDIYPPEMWALESLIVLKDNLVAARLVHRNFENVIKAYGDKVQTRKPVILTSHTWAGQSGTQASSTIRVDNLTANDVSITLDTLRYTAFIVQDKDAATSIKDLREEFLMPAIIPIAKDVDTDILYEMWYDGSSDVEGNALSIVAYDAAGIAADLNEDDLIKARETLQTNQCPLEDLRLVCCVEHESDLLRLALFHQADQSGSTDALTNANLGTKFGFDIYTTQNLTNYDDTDTTPISLAFHKNVCALVTRPLLAPTDVRSATRDLDGISMRVTSQYDIHLKGVVVSFDCLYGVQLLDANLGVVVNP
jgi:hypothetical protein